MKTKLSLKKVELLAIRAFYIFLALAVFFSSTGVVLNKHFCQNELKSSAFFFLPESCHSKMKKAICPNHPQPAMAGAQETDNGCCNNDAEYVKVEQDKQLQVVNEELEMPAALSLFIVAFFSNYQQPATTNRYNTYKPPIVRSDIQVLLQTFLI